jgi:steroid 5-alpha reductase family enzyme
MNPLIMIGVGWAAMAVVMALLWLVQTRTGDAGIVDVAWGMGVAGIASLFAWGSFHGDVTRRWVVAVLAATWAIRLSGYVLHRVLTMPEDGRYQQLKREWGTASQSRMFRFYQLQAIGSLLFALPMLVAVRNPSPFGAVDVLGIAIWCLAIAGETIADRQLDRFRKDPNNQGRVCRRGLWRYSRHPNYFFEWLHWWSYFAMSVTYPWGWISILGPLVMWFLITRVTGIPPTEAQSIRSRGDEYREYQRTTSAFFPWFPKSSRHVTTSGSPVI